MTDVQIDIYGPTAKISGPYPKNAVRLVTSYPVEGAHFAQTYRKGMWDGRKHLFRSTSSTFPTGLTGLVKEACELAGAVVTIVDHRNLPKPKGGTYDLVGVKMDGKYDYQLDAAQKAVAAKQGILRIATNGGKCLHPDTLVMLASGDVKAAKDIRTGDYLMGPDSLPRTVKSTCTGRGPMYKIIPNVGDPWICNDVHVLTLRDSRRKGKHAGEVVDIALSDYLASNKNKKHLLKQFSVGVDYPLIAAPTINPYFLGVWFGDGRKDLSQGIQVTTMDAEIVEALRETCEDWNLWLSKYNSASSGQADTYGLVSGKGNPLLNEMRSIVGDASSLPASYLRGSRRTRKLFLAGLLDTDGHLEVDSKGFEITQVRLSYAEGIQSLARSLGFRANIKPKVVNGTTYYRIHIYGDLHTIPTRLPRKQAKARKHAFRLNTGFRVEPLGDGDYAGFTLDGDGRFLLGDFTVTHNTEIACAITQYLGLNTLFMVTTRELLYQARDRFMARLGMTEAEVGIIGDGHWEPGSWVTIATIDTLESRLDRTECADFLKTIEVLFADECHHLGSETWYEICTLCPANYRYGLSGTPMDRTDGANLRLLAAIGDIIVDIPNKFLVERGISARTTIIFSKVTAPVLKKKITYSTAYKQGITDNPNALSMVVDWVKVFHSLGLGTLVLCEEIAHGKAIDEALWTATGGQFIPHQFIYGDEDTDVRRNTLKDFGEGRLPVLIASTILDEGVDVPTIDALILAGSRKSRIKTMQRLGRGLRGKKLIAVEFANFCHDYLLRHSLQRYEDYKKEDCFPLYQSGPSVELVQKLWNDDAAGDGAKAK